MRKAADHDGGKGKRTTASVQAVMKGAPTTCQELQTQQRAGTELPHLVGIMAQRELIKGSHKRE